MRKLLYTALIGVSAMFLPRAYTNNNNYPKTLDNQPFHTVVAIPKDGTIVENIPTKTPDIYVPKNIPKGKKMYAKNVKPVILNTLRIYK